MRQKNPLHLLQIAYRLVLVAFLIMILLLSVLQRNQVYNPWRDEKPDIVEITDYKVREEKDADAPAGFHRDYVIQLKKGSIVNEAWLYIFFSHTYVKVYFEEYPDDPIYMLTPKKDHKNLGRSPGNRWAAIPMYEGDWGSKLIIRTYPVYPGYLMKPKILLGTQSDVSSYIMNRGMIPLVQSIALLILGVSVLFLYEARKKKHQSFEGLDQLGLLCILDGFWRITDIKMAPFIFRDISSVLSYFSLSMLFLLPVPVTRYVYNRVRLSKKWPLYLTTGAYIAFDFAAFILQIFGICDLRELLPYFQMLAIGGGLLMFVMVHLDLRMRRGQSVGQKRERPRILALIAVSTALFLGIVIDMIFYYFGNSNMPVSTLVFLCYVLATLIYNYRQLSQSANFDTATRIANKNSCIRALAEIGNGDGQAGKDADGSNETALVMLDLNYLKQTNDNYGHESGDRLLSAFAEMLKTIFDKEDFVGRYGGDEFLIIVRGKGVEHVTERIDRLEDLVRHTPVVLAGKQTIYISFSAGCANSHEFPDADGWSLLKTADERMYEDKVKKHAERKSSSFLQENAMNGR